MEFAIILEEIRRQKQAMEEMDALRPRLQIPEYPEECEEKPEPAVEEHVCIIQIL